ncbi:hypothetical protein ACROYT_G007825 [Oculina patagonica]
MAEDLEKQTDFLKFSRNMKKATMRNTVQGDSLKKDLKCIQRERKRLMHSWEQRKQAFVQQKCGKRPVIRWSGENIDKEDTMEQLSEQKTSSGRYSTTDKIKSAHERSELSSLKFYDSSHENKELYTMLGDNKTNMSCMPKLTVKDLSRILCPEKRFPVASLNETKEMHCHTGSPSTPNRLHHRFSSLYIKKDAPEGNDSSGLTSSSRTPVQMRSNYRSLSLNASELNEARKTKMMPISPISQQRKRAITWSPRQTYLTVASDRDNSASKNRQQQANHKMAFERHLSCTQSRELRSPSQQSTHALSVKNLYFPHN